MAYAHIDNLYKFTDILMFKECYALEKVHGTSAHLRFINKLDEPNRLIYFWGGSNEKQFKSLFNETDLVQAFKELGHSDIYVYGEAYGGRLQGMSDTYGKDLRFIVFDVLVGDKWLSVPNAHDVANKLGLEFIPYERISTDLKEIDRERDRDSEVAIRCGMGPGKIREGVILRPIEELHKNSGKRIICKHKRKEFSETKTPREVDPTKTILLKEANEIASEWVTEERLRHVLDKMPADTNVESTGSVIDNMLEDIKREGEGEIVWSKEACKAISRETGKMFRTLLQKRLESLASSS